MEDTEFVDAPQPDQLDQPNSSGAICLGSGCD